MSHYKKPHARKESYCERMGRDLEQIPVICVESTVLAFLVISALTILFAVRFAVIVAEMLTVPAPVWVAGFALTLVITGAVVSIVVVAGRLLESGDQFGISSPALSAKQYAVP